ncbi:endopeptidase Rz [Serratia phage vB_SspM_BZS1]|nr:endopeptidase Rz [Serratia phage vB_SspM_BZS1]
MNRLTGSIVAVLLIIFIALAWLAFHFHGNAVEAGGKVKQLQSDNNLQTATIATQALHFQRANEISTAATQYGINTDAATQGKEIEYRTILKNQPTCDLAVPTAIAGGLLNYTHRLRSGAMSGDTANADTTSAGTTPTGTLTYCQAVLWIDPLLAAIDKANNQLLAIRQLDDERQ